MLTQIRVHNFAIIDDLSLEFAQGLNIVTGETGSGKSLLIKSLSLLMGEKGNHELIKHGCAFARVEGVFDISERSDIKAKLKELSLTKEEGDLLIVRRIIQPDKTKVYINDTLVTLQTLRNIVFPLVDLTSKSAPLIEITGQFENKNLLNKAFHAEILDQYCELASKKAEYSTLYDRYLEVLQKLDTAESTKRELKQKSDFLLFQKKEIEVIDPKENEEIEIEGTVKALKNQARLAQFHQLAQGYLSEGSEAIIPSLQSLLKKSHEFESLHPTLPDWFSSLSESLETIKDLSFRLDNAIKIDEESEQQLEHLQARLSDLRKLQKKYGPTTRDVLNFYEKVKNELSLFETFDDTVLELEKEKSQLVKQLTQLATDLHEARLSRGPKLSAQINSHLKDLNMKGIQFQVEVTRLDNFGPNGISDVEFKVKMGAQNALYSLAKVASGGELSRVLLALKVVVSQEKWPRTYLFDEVDTGVSGVTAEKVGRKLRAVSKSQQVICVTHLPQVAAFGDHHYVIEKEANETSTQAKVVAYRLHEKDRVKEIARLLSGEKITQVSLKHASDLVEQVRDANI
jgi:DNA repair protein RecN (Recombination protein N)